MAVDEDENEGLQSGTVVGTPLKKATESVLKPSAPEPVLTTATLPETSPETGPATNILIALSLMGSLDTLSSQIGKARNFLIISGHKNTMFAQTIVLLAYTLNTLILSE